MGRLSERADAERQGLTPEEQVPEREPWEVAWDEWFPKYRPSTITSRLAFHDGFQIGQANARAELRAAVREALPAEDPLAAEWWCCPGDYPGHAEDCPEKENS